MATLNPDRLAELEEERRFLLRSLRDLEREHAAGDVDEVDYRELKDGYTARAAATLREIEQGRSTLPSKPAANWRRRLLALGAIVVAIGVVSWVLIASSAERKAGQEVTGLDPRSERQVLMAQARSVQFRQPGVAAELYAQVLELDPDDVEAMTYFGWTVGLDASSNPTLTSEQVEQRLGQSVDLLEAATQIDPAYPDPRCFLGIVHFRFLDQAEQASPWIDECLAGNPPADIRGLVEPLRAQIDERLT